SNLSASGSKNFPIFVTKLYLRAICPSKKSVNAAIEKIRVATKSTTGNVPFPIDQAPQSKGKDNKIIKIGIKNILEIVILFGKFIFVSPLSSSISDFQNDKAGAKVILAFKFASNSLQPSLG